jgi:competence ComEA-like helix-hairpin-helix protein
MLLRKCSLLTVTLVVLFTATACQRSMSNTSIAIAESPLPNAVNINTATVDELIAIPNVGEKLARQIVDFRNTNGPFQRPEDLILVPGISDKRFRQIRNMVRTD